MNKIVYSFWITSVRKYWEKNKIPNNFEHFLKLSINVLVLSVLHAKKRGFVCEVVTDMETFPLLKQLPFDNISTELTMLKGQEYMDVKAKMMMLMIQKEPFVHLSWDAVLKNPYVIDTIKNCNQDLLVADVHQGQDFLKRYASLRDFSIFMDLSGYFVKDFHTSYYKGFDTRIVGFNDMQLKDQYIADFFKCLEVALKRPDPKLAVVLDEYLLFVVASRNKSSVQNLQLHTTNASKKGNTAKRYVQMLSYYKNDLKRINSKVKNEITTKFPKWNFLVRPKQKMYQKVKISLCTVVMNRKEQLLKTLENNIRVANHFDDVDVNVLNYNSTDGLEQILFSKPWFVEAIRHKKLKYYRNYEAQYYHRTLPKNKIHQLSEGAYILNVDADNFVSHAYLKFCLHHIKHNPQRFFIRSSKIGGSYGRILVNRKDFNHLQGYNLKMKAYGFEDTDFMLRLKALGIHQILCPIALCSDVIEHGDQLRVINEYDKVDAQYANMILQRSDSLNRSLGFDLYPNKHIKMDCPVVSLNFLRRKIG